MQEESGRLKEAMPSWPFSIASSMVEKVNAHSCHLHVGGVYIHAKYGSPGASRSWGTVRTHTHIFLKRLQRGRVNKHYYTFKYSLLGHSILEANYIWYLGVALIGLLIR